MTTTFYLPETNAPTARAMFAGWQCNIERLDGKSCNITFWNEDEWKRFEQFAESQNIKFELV